MKWKLTKQERNWVLYDVGNSAFTLLIATILPIYFNYLADKGGLSDVEYLAYWGYAASVVTLLVALLGPVIGTLADTEGYKKPIFIAFIVVGIIACVSLGIAENWLLFLVIFIIAKVGYSGSLIFYDSMLSDVTTKERMDDVSSRGYAWGYIGSCIPFVICLFVVLGSGKLGLSMEAAMGIAFVIISAWWLLFSLPLLRTYRQKYYIKKKKNAVADSFKRIGRTLKNAGNEKKILFFLIAFFFYIDGVYTIIDMATAYGTALGLDSTGLLLALLVTQIVAFPAALIFGRLAGKVSASRLITVSIGAYFLIALYGIILKEQYQFWILAVVVGIFQGAIQSMSRSYFVKIIPADKSGEYFGIYDICGKGAAFAGTMVVSLISQLSGSVNLGVGALSVMFLIGIFFFLKADKTPLK